MFTAYEKKGILTGLKLAFIGDGNNVAAHFVRLRQVGVHMSLACPKAMNLRRWWSRCCRRRRRHRRQAGDCPRTLRRPQGRILFTQTSASMGQEQEKAEREKHFAQYQVNSRLMAAAKPDAVVMHCLPAHRGEEITDEVIDGKNSVVYDEAENRLHVQGHHGSSNGVIAFSVSFFPCF